MNTVEMRDSRSSELDRLRRVMCIRKAYWSVSDSKTDNSPFIKGSSDSLGKRPESRGGQEIPNFPSVFRTWSLTLLERLLHPLNPTTERRQTRTMCEQLRLSQLDKVLVPATYIVAIQFAGTFVTPVNEASDKA